MGRLGKTSEVPVRDLVPYANNARIHDDEQVEMIAKSIAEFGFLNPVLIDKDKNIIAGHGRVLAAKKLGLERVPALYVEGLTEEQRRAYVLADNRLTELGGWSMPTVNAELEELAEAGFDIDLTGFDLSVDNSEWFTTRERDDTSREEGNDEYNEFLDKFEIKKTTDDCYTPDGVYEAVAAFVASEYKVKRETFFRPFYPGGDYQREDYTGKIVVDNPPFSILAEILTYYATNGIRFFLFAPTLTLFSSSGEVTALPTGVAVLYENGASVNTSFLTNLEPADVRVRTAPALYKAIEAAVDEYRKEIHKELPKYSYPDEILTATMAARWCKYGVEYTLKKKDSEGIYALDAQKESGKAIYGKGYILSETAAAERAAAERAAAEQEQVHRWTLSERELEIVKRLGGE